jgi:hypothetical protein
VVLRSSCLNDPSAWEGEMHMGRYRKKVGASLVATLAIAGVPLALASPAGAADTDVRVTEVAPRGNSTPLGDDWFELTNTGATALNLTGWSANDNGGSAVAMSGVTTLAAGESAIFVMEAGAASVQAYASQWFGGTLPAGLQVGWVDGSGLGLSNDGDSVRVYNASATLVASVTYGTAPSGSPIPTLDNTEGLNSATISTVTAAGVNGAFPSSNEAEVGSPGLATAGGGPTDPEPGETFATWPGGTTVTPAEEYSFGSDMSGLDYEASGTAAHGVLWAARNKAGTLFRLVHDGAKWVPDSTNSWGAGKTLRYPGGVGHPDSEGVTYIGDSAADGIFIASERDNDNSGVSRNSVLRYDPSATGAELVATQEWNLTSVLPATGANLGLEAVTWIDDAHLVEGGFVDDVTGQLYNPASYPNHGAGLFFVSLEQTAQIYALALASTGEATLIATFPSDLGIVTDLQYDREQRVLWAEADNTDNGRLTTLELAAASGDFAITGRYERPAGLGNNNNEGFAIAPNALCVNGAKPVYWSDDNETGGVSIVEGSLDCDTGPTPVVPEFPAPAVALLAAGALAGGWLALRRRSAAAIG